jgi:hypothetical protein
MPNGNQSLFEKAENWYINRGHCIINPHNVANHLGDVPETTIVRDELASITTHVDHIALLPGWQDSRYGMVEVAVGIASGIPFVRAFSFDPIYPQIKLMAYGSKSYKELACRYRSAAQTTSKEGMWKEKPRPLRKHLRTA